MIRLNEKGCRVRACVKNIPQVVQQLVIEIDYRPIGKEASTEMPEKSVKLCGCH